jgi:hypothetical protein
MNSMLEQMAKKLPLIYIIILNIFGIILMLVYKPISTPSINWMWMYYPSDLQNLEWRDIGHFMTELRTGIPPVLGGVELLLFKLFGTSDLLTVWGYRLSLLLMYSITIVLFARNRLQYTLTFIVSLVALHASILIHPNNPQLYDYFLPLCLLLYLGFLLLIAPASGRGKIGFALLAGFFVSMAELLRPFILFILPVIVLLTFINLRQQPRRVFLAFLVPIILFSGTWHLKLFLINNGQTTWSNYSGYNLRKAWSYIDDWPEMEVDPTSNEYSIEVGEPPVGRVRLGNLNTQVTYNNSQLLQRHFIDYVVSNPLETVLITLIMVADLLRPHTQMNNWADGTGNFGGPSGAIVFLYKLTVPVLSLISIANLIIAVFRQLPRRPLLTMGNPIFILLFITWLYIFLLAIGDQGEEARFMLSVLPLFAALPFPVLDVSKSAVEQTHNSQSG